MILVYMHLYWLKDKRYCWQLSSISRLQAILLLYRTWHLEEAGHYTGNYVSKQTPPAVRSNEKRKTIPQIPVIICAHAASEYCFLAASVCLSVCVTVRTISQKLLIRNWCNLVWICPMVNAKSTWRLMTFDLDLWPWVIFSYFFPSQALSFEFFKLAASFSVWMYIFRISIGHLRVSRSWG